MRAEGVALILVLPKSYYMMLLNNVYFLEIKLCGLYVYINDFLKCRYYWNEEKINVCINLSLYYIKVFTLHFPWSMVAIINMVIKKPMVCYIKNYTLYQEKLSLLFWNFILPNNHSNFIDCKYILTFCNIMIYLYGSLKCLS